MILTPTSGTDGTGTDKTGEITDSIKKEEVENLLSSNKKIMIHTHHDEEENKFRKNIEAFLEQIVDKNEFNLGKIIDYHIFTEGVSSVVAKITTEDTKEYIFKSHNNTVQGGDRKTYIEAKALDIRRNIGVKTPIIYQEGSKKFNGREIPYIIMEYIKPTRKLTEENEQKIAYEIGENIAKISKSKGKGFGWIKKIENDIPIGEYNTIEKYYDALERKMMKLLTENNLIEEKERIKLHKAIQIVKEDLYSGTKAVLNHEDVRFDNIFLTEPITIFDPNIRLDHPLMDLATTQYYLLMKNIIPGDRKDIREKNLWEGYEKTTGGKIDKNIFNACLAIRIMQKIGIIYKYPEGGKRVKKALEILHQIQLT